MEGWGCVLWTLKRHIWQEVRVTGENTDQLDRKSVKVLTKAEGLEAKWACSYALHCLDALRQATGLSRLQPPGW